MKQYQKDALSAARDLGYPQETKDQIINANSEIEVTRAMITARQNRIKQEREQIH